MLSTCTARMVICSLIVALGTLAPATRSTTPMLAQAAATNQAAGTIDQALLSGLRWRSIGPPRGGRSIAVSGSSSRPHEYYFGATGGGLWKTTDGGITWRAMADPFFKTSSVGAVAVAESNPDVVYAGMGEVALRGNVIQGDGVYKTTDAGKTWSHMGLEKTHGHRPHPRPSVESRHRVRGSARRSVRSERRSRRVQVERRRQDVGQGPLQRATRRAPSI